MIRLLINFSMFSILICSGLVVSVWNNQEAQALDPSVIKSRLNHLPMTIGEWDGTEIDSTESIPEDIGPLMMRRYVHRTSGAAISIMLTANRPGPLLVNHTPLDCYPPQGFALASDPSRYTLSLDPLPASEFLVAVFSKTQGPLPVHLRVFWSWSGSGDWQVPAQPRIAFARYAALYKLYVVHQLFKPGEPLEGEPAISFLRVFVPDVKRTIFDKS